MLTAPLTPSRKFSVSSYLAGFNSLRALGALLVCARHFSGLLPERERVDFLRELVTYGPTGVYLFFVISGYILPYSLLRQDYQLSKLGTYLKRRFVRIAPAFYVAALLTLFQWVIIDKFVNHGVFYTRDITPARLAHNFFFTVPFTEYKWVVSAAWTLGVEWQFYLVLGLLFPLLFTIKRAGLWFTLFYGLVGLLGARLAFGLHFLTFSSLFALGGTTLLWQRGQLPLAGYLGSLGLFTGLAVYQLSPWAAGVGLMTVPAILFSTRPIPVLSSIGKMAYSFALTHMLVGQTAEFVLYRLIQPTSDAGRLLVLGICLLVALGAAIPFYRWVEQPFTQLAKRMR